MKKIIGLPVLVLSLAFSQSTFAHHQDQTHSCMKMIFENIKLTPEQQTKIQALKEQTRMNLKDKWQEMHALHDKMKPLIQSENFDEAKVDAVINEKTTIIGSVMKANAMTRHQIYMLLDAKQRTAFTAGMDTCEKSEHMMKDSATTQPQ